MNYKLKVTNIELTEGLNDRAEKCAQRLNKFLKKGDDSLKCEYEIGMTTRHHHHKDDLFHAEIRLHTAGKNLHTESFHEDLYTAIEEATDKMVLEVTEHYDKKRTIMRRSAHKIKSVLKGLINRK